MSFSEFVCGFKKYVSPRFQAAMLGNYSFTRNVPSAPEVNDRKAL